MNQPNATPKVSPQERWKCACPSWTTRKQCMAVRYGRAEQFGDLSDDECECACHEEAEHDDA